MLNRGKMTRDKSKKEIYSEKYPRRYLIRNLQDTFNNFRLKSNSFILLPFIPSPYESTIFAFVLFSLSFTSCHSLLIQHPNILSTVDASPYGKEQNMKLAAQGEILNRVERSPLSPPMVTSLKPAILKTRKNKLIKSPSYNNNYVQNDSFAAPFRKSTTVNKSKLLKDKLKNIPKIEGGSAPKSPRFYSKSKPIKKPIKNDKMANRKRGPIFHTSSSKSNNRTLDFYDDFNAFDGIKSSYDQEKIMKPYMENEMNRTEVKSTKEMLEILRKENVDSLDKFLDLVENGAKWNELNELFHEYKKNGWKNRFNVESTFKKSIDEKLNKMKLKKSSVEKTNTLQNDNRNETKLLKTKRKDYSLSKNFNKMNSNYYTAPSYDSPMIQPHLPVRKKDKQIPVAISSFKVIIKPSESLPMRSFVQEKTKESKQTTKKPLEHKFSRLRLVFPMKGILIFCGVVGILAIITILILIIYSTVKCNRKTSDSQYHLTDSQQIDSSSLGGSSFKSIE